MSQFRSKREELRADPEIKEVRAYITQEVWKRIKVQAILDDPSGVGSIDTFLSRKLTEWYGQDKQKKP